MPEHHQHAIARAVREGPGALPAGLFAGSAAAVLRGMKIHANTIWHAWLVALEDTYPRTRAALGDAAFNALSRQFLETPGPAAQPLAHIGTGFADFLAGLDAAAACAGLARVEWAWLQSYHAADAAPLALADLAGLGEAGLLDAIIARHPAAQIVHIDAQTGHWLASDAPDLATQDAILVTRPADVQLSAAPPLVVLLLASITCPISIGDVLVSAAEHAPAESLFPALLHLINAGALIAARKVPQ